MFDEMAIELIRALISKLAVPGDTGFELLALFVLVCLLIWRRRK